ncbi:hypothetical protein [Nocardia jejuensis]|uniref:hypothetical protein n=1 Tax=Nocardia jejuensis TaxID=328049 RepID=UPI000833B193|nr:hypothetical protein [Nocardia jejuensis]
MRSGRPTEEQLRHNFEAALAAALQGQGVRSSTGLDSPTQDALWAIARARPEAREDMVDAARRSFAGQLDGSNAARWREELERTIAERRSSSEGK